MYDGLLIVLSGPSGAGKGTIHDKVLKILPNIKKSISVTTRKKRINEIERVHYYFKTEEEYSQMIADGEFLETASVYCHNYGTPKAPVFEMLKNGNDVIFEIDNFGSRQIKKKYPDALTIYIMPPSFKELESRLIARGTESADSLATRLGNAKRELSEYNDFDYIVFNDDADVAAEKVVAIIRAEKSRMNRNEHIIKGMLENKK